MSRDANNYDFIFKCHPYTCLMSEEGKSYINFNAQYQIVVFSGINFIKKGG